ncbi:MAG TPA: hypothetical protein VFP34_03295 [Microlunatus sp.]|nr:hypothetical protein [Microlunatus sp.]
MAAADTAIPPIRARATWRTAGHWWVALLAAGLAVGLRLIALVRGGGLFGLGNYDDGVYYSAGSALLHGVVPYRDFVLLHPPGIVLLLAPFGLFGLAGHDPWGLAAARLAWIALGGVNTVLVARILRRVGLVESAMGAVLYATAYPAIYIEWTPLLEAPAQTCVLLTILLLQTSKGAAPTLAQVAGAGALIGFSATVKIWGAAAVVAVIVWFLIGRQWRQALRFTTAAAVTITAVCGPFWLLSPGSMWRMVVLDQLNRAPSTTTVWTKAAGIIGLGWHRPALTSPDGWLLAGLAVAAATVVASAWVWEVRLATVLTLILSLVLMVSPSWFLHYPGLVTGPLAVCVAAGGGLLLRRAIAWRPAAAVVTAIVLGAVALAAIIPSTQVRLGRRFPAAALSGRVAQTTCVTSDDPTALVQLNVLTTNLDHGCRFVADLGGYSYELATQRGHWTPRRLDAAWQDLYLSYVRSGTQALPFRYAETGALSPETRTTLRSWPPAAQAGRYILRTVEVGR